MKCSTIATLLALTTATCAAPILEDRTNEHEKIKLSTVFNFTSTYEVKATPDQVVNGTGDNLRFTGGLPGAKGYFKYGINSDLDLICYNIKLVDFKGNYSSPAKTATHIHEAAQGKNGPPRLAFPNPEGKEHDRIRYSFGCMRGPFTTGLPGPDGKDTGLGFKVKQIEDNPAAFFTDVHSTLALPGAVRGQLPGKFVKIVHV